MRRSRVCSCGLLAEYPRIGVAGAGEGAGAEAEASVDSDLAGWVGAARVFVLMGEA